MKIRNQKLIKDQNYLRQFIKVGEAAEILGMTRNTVYSRMREGKLQTVTIYEGTTAEEVLFYREQVEALK